MHLINLPTRVPDFTCNWLIYRMVRKLRNRAVSADSLRVFWSQKFPSICTNLKTSNLLEVTNFGAAKKTPLWVLEGSSWVFLFYVREGWKKRWSNFPLNTHTYQAEHTHRKSLHVVPTHTCDVCSVFIQPHNSDFCISPFICKKLYNCCTCWTSQSSQNTTELESLFKRSLLVCRSDVLPSHIIRSKFWKGKKNIWITKRRNKGQNVSNNLRRTSVSTNQDFLCFLKSAFAR